MAEIIPIIGGAKLSKDIVKEFGSAFRDLKTFGETGARDVRDAVDTVNKFIGVVNPFIVPLKLLMAEFTTGTLESSMKLTKELIILLQDDTTQKGIDNLIEFINRILNSSANMIRILNEMESLGDRLEKVSTKIESSMNRIENSILLPFERIENSITTTISKIETAITAPFERIETVITKVGEKITEVWDKIKIW